MSGDQSEWQTCSYRNCRQQNQLLVIKFFLQKLHKRIGNTGIVIEKNGRRYVHDITQRASCLQRFATTLLTKTNLYPGNVASFTLRLETRGEALDFFFAETINTFSLQVRSTNAKGRASPKIGVNRYRRQQRFDKLRYQHQDKKKLAKKHTRFCDFPTSKIKLTRTHVKPWERIETMLDSLHSFTMQLFAIRNRLNGTFPGESSCKKAKMQPIACYPANQSEILRNHKKLS